jgi:hypothetical protein
MARPASADGVAELQDGAPEARSEADSQAASNTDPVSGRLHLSPGLHVVHPTFGRTRVSGHHPRAVFTQVTGESRLHLLGGSVACGSSVGGILAWMTGTDGLIIEPLTDWWRWIAPRFSDAMHVLVSEQCDLIPSSAGAGPALRVPARCGRIRQRDAAVRGGAGLAGMAAGR